MYRSLYTLGIRSYGLAIWIAQFWNIKAKSWIKGRENWANKIQDTLTSSQSIVWFHAASLGEAEQGVPIMKQLRAEFPEKKLLLTFFSPSGMEHFKNPGLADYLFYLPLDTSYNARKFLKIVNPDLAFFIKYEIWPNFFKEIQNQEIPLIIAPAIFRREQVYFKPPHSSFFLPILQRVDHILVQNEDSKTVLAEHGIVQASVCGDSRFERVKQNVAMPFENATLENFSRNQKVLIGGSTWSEDESIIKQLLDWNQDLKVILAPHDISASNIERIIRLFGSDKAFQLSTAEDAADKYQVCIVDSIGMLSRLYRFGQLAYIGGAFGKGIHNSLEAAAYGLPLFFGPRHTNFIEPQEMLDKGFAFEILNAQDLQKHFKPIYNSPERLKELKAHALKYVDQKTGAVTKIMTAIKQSL